MVIFNSYVKLPEGILYTLARVRTGNSQSFLKKNTVPTFVVKRGTREWNITMM
jgi:hypothetical protein